MSLAECAEVRPNSVEVLDPGSLEVRAAEVASRQRATTTRRTYASVYRGFCSWLAAETAPPGAGLHREVQEGRSEVTAVAVRAYRDELERVGRSPATIAKQLSALRVLAAELGADAEVQLVRSERVDRREPRALAFDEYARLLRMPDRRRTAGKRDLALLYLLGDAGLRRSELCALTYEDVEERRRGPDRRHRRAVIESTIYAVRVRGKRGRERRVPLSGAALEALVDWSDTRPTCRSERLFVSLPRAPREPGPLSTRDLARIVGRHAALAGLPEDRRAPHVLRHTFCTLLAERGVALEVIAELAGHADVRTSRGYVDVAAHRLERAVADAFDHGRGALARAGRA